MFGGIWLKGAYVLSALFMVFAFVFIGVPSLSRYAAVVCVAMIAWIGWGVYGGTAAIPKVLALPFICFAFLEFACLFEPEFPIQYSGRLFTVWTGGMGLAVLVANGVRLRYVSGAFFLIACLNIVAILVGYDGFERNVVGEQNLAEHDTPRYSGLAGQSNVLSSLALIPLFLLLLQDRKVSLEEFVLLVLMATLITGYTGSRNALLLTILFIVLAAVFLLSQNRHRAWVLGIGIGLSLGWAIISLSPSLRTLIEFSPLGSLTIVKRIIGMSDGIDMSAIARSQAWEVFGKHYFDHPFFGHGPEAFETLTPYGNHAHNNFLELALNSGIFASLLYYSMYFRMVLASAFSSQVERLRLGSVVAVLLLADTWDVNYLSRVVVAVLCISLIVASREFKPEVLS